MGDDEIPDKLVEEIAISRTPTTPLPPTVARMKMQLDLEDAEAVAAFLEAVAKSIRDKRRIVLIIE